MHTSCWNAMSVLCRNETVLSSTMQSFACYLQGLACCQHIDALSVNAESSASARYGETLARFLLLRGASEMAIHMRKI